MQYDGRMSTKTIVISIIVIIIVAAGGYFIYKSMNNSGAPQNQQQAGAAATPTDQVQGQEVKIGTGAEATPGSQVSVLYVGKLPDGTVFDSSASHGNQPLVFILGSQGLIPGFQIGINGMKEGGERLLSIPPALAYGAQDVKDPNGNLVIPANSTLIFDVQLVKVEATTTKPAAQ